MDDSKLRDLASDCVHCGFCLPACPTYSLWGEEMDSPRGRIHLITQVLDGAELSAAAAEHFDRCLGCMACVTACPSGVQYDRLIEAARAWTDDPAHAPAVVPTGSVAGADGPGVQEVAGADGPEAGSEEDTGPVPGGAPARVLARRGARGGGPAGGVPVGGGRHRPLRDRAARSAIFAVFPYPRRLRALAGPLRLLQRTGLDRLVARSGLPGRVSPVLGAAMNLAPRPGAPVPSGRLPERVPGARDPPRGGRDAHRVRAVGLLPAGQHRDRACPRGRGLRRGHPPRAGVLRGAVAALGAGRGGGRFRPARHRDVRAGGCRGDRRQLRGLRFGDEGVRRPAGRRSGMGRRGRPRSAPRSATSPSSWPICSRSAGGPVAARHPLPVRAAYHDACHLAHAQRITAAPRALLDGIPGLELTEIPEAGMCCGSAGVYNLLQPEAARELGQRKAGVGAQHRGAAADLGQPGVLAADRVRPGGAGRDHRDRAHGRDPGRLDPGRARAAAGGPG